MSDDLIERLRDGVCYVGFHPTLDEVEANSVVMHGAAEALSEALEQAKHYPTVAGENMRLREEAASTQEEILRLRKALEKQGIDFDG